MADDRDDGRARQRDRAMAELTPPRSESAADTSEDAWVYTTEIVRVEDVTAFVRVLALPVRVTDFDYYEESA